MDQSNSKPKRKRITYRDPSRIRILRRSPEEKERLLRDFRKEVESGETSTLVARKLGVSLNSIYKWDKQRNEIRQNLLRDNLEQGIEISAAIAILSNPSKFTDHLLREAIFKYTVWLKWPANVNDHLPAVVACVIAYLYKRSGAKTLSALDPECLSYVVNNLRIDVLARNCSRGDFWGPLFFDLFNIDEQPYTHLDALADIAWYLIASVVHSKRSNETASLSKVHFLLGKKAFKYVWTLSITSFRKFWKEQAATSPFLYIERFHSGLNWDIDPAAESFVADVDELIARKNDFPVFFARCRWAVEMLQTRLDKRASRLVTFPDFPPELRPVPVEPPRLSRRIEAELKGYTISYKAMK